MKLIFDRKFNHLKIEKLNFDILYFPCQKIMNNIKIGTYVYKDEMIGFYENEIVYSPVSGYIRNIQTEKVLLKDECLSLVVENDYMEKRKIGSIAKKIEGKKDFLEELKRFSISELELFVHLEEVLIVDFIENEPYYFHSQIMNLYIENYLDFCSTIAEYFQLKKVVLFVKETDEALINLINLYIGTFPEIELNIVEDKYYAKKEDLFNDFYKTHQAINYLTLLYLCKAIMQGKVGTHLYLNIILNNSDVIIARIPYGVKFLDLKEYLEEEDASIIVNGLLGGTSIVNANQIITKKIRSIFFQKEKIITMDCINCGKCVEICPMGCNPKWLIDHQDNQFVQNCNDCGLCNYICPSNIRLKEMIRRNKNEDILQVHK